MQQSFVITKDRSNQIIQVKKLFPFELSEKQITYQTIIDLKTLIMKQEYQSDDVEKYRNHLYLLLMILQKILEQLIKIYQIVNISRLNMENILVDLSNENLPVIHFINLHETGNLISFDENLQEIKQISSQVLMNHQNQLVQIINDKQQTNQIIIEIHYITILSNEFLTTLQTFNNLNEIQEFIKQKKIEYQDSSPLKQNNIIKI